MKSESEVLELLDLIVKEARYYAETLEALREEQRKSVPDAENEYRAMLYDLAQVAGYALLRVAEGNPGMTLVADELQAWLDDENSEYDEYFNLP